MKRKVGRVTPCAPLLGMSNHGAHGVTRPTFSDPRFLAPMSNFAIVAAAQKPWRPGSQRKAIPVGLMKNHEWLRSGSAAVTETRPESKTRSGQGFYLIWGMFSGESGGNLPPLDTRRPPAAGIRPKPQPLN